jgi:hypothetical protein
LPGVRPQRHLKRPCGLDGWRAVDADPAADWARARGTRHFPTALLQPPHPPISYHTPRLERDLAHRQSAGFPGERGAQAILSDARGSPIGAAAILALLGAVLFAFAVMSFVAAQCSGMPKLTRLAQLIALLWACRAVAGALFSRQASATAHAALKGLVLGGKLE